MKALATALFVLLPVSAFPGSKNDAPSAAAAAECHHPAAPPSDAGQAKKEEAFKVHRGAKFSGAPTVKVEELLQHPERHAGKTVTMTGTVRRACEKKGCWMEIALSEKAAGVRVTFKDYGFFVPLDSAGATAVVEGVVKVADLSEATAAHYEGEGAIVPRGKDGKPREVQLVASAVELSR